ncbi:MAG: RHS repeat-associated core domain-containing protein [Saprospiraceae bacterium]
MGNVLATVSDRHISRAAAPGAVNYYLADILTQTDYYPFGMGMPGRTFSGEKYRYGFNGKENDNEIHGTGNQQDYGDRLFDSRLGRWLSIDPLQSKYADLTPYSFAGDNPIRFVDFNGQDFGVKINHTDKTIVIVSNIYTTSKKAYNEVQKAAKQWNDKSATIEGYLVSFQIKIMEPVSSITNDEAILEDPSIIRRNGRINIRKLNEAKKVLISQKVTRGAKYDKENAGNAYASNEGRNSKYVTGEVFTGGQTENGRYADMNTHESLGNMGAIADLVAHEIGHFMGLNDHDKGPYYANGGIMEYSGTDLAPVSVDDVKNILSFAKNAFLKKTDPRAAKVSLIENVGKSNGINPLGIKNE